VIDECPRRCCTVLIGNSRPPSTFRLMSQLTVDATPLPAALPLFATGLGALGLLGWRRRSKTLGDITQWLAEKVY
jgi:hypothetical protein